MFVWRKNTKKIVCFVALVLALVLGSLFFFLNNPSSPASSDAFATCQFNPDISDKNKALIDETINTVADDGLFSLMGEKSHLEETGAILSKEVPDLVYWAYILSSPQLTQKAQVIQESSPKYHGFIQGTRDRLMRKYRENPCLLEQAKGFAKYLDLPPEETVQMLKECIDNDDKGKYEFKKFLDYIIGKKAKQSADS